MVKLSGVQLGEDIPIVATRQILKIAQQNKREFQQKRKQSKMNTILKSIANIFIPLIPAFIGAGLIGGIGCIEQLYYCWYHFS